QAFQASFLISLIAPILGLFLILRRQTLLADTLSHVSLVGVALGLLLGIAPTWMNLLVVVIVSILLEYIRSVYKTYSEISIAIMMSGGMALALVLMSLNDSSAMSLNSFLFGSIVTITTEQILFLLVITLAIILLYIFFRRPMYVLTFDEETAFTSGLPVRTMSIAFNIITGMTIAIVMPIVGALLVSAILILPAAISMRLSKSFNGVILIGIVVAMFGMFGGLVLSYYVGTPPGATITLIFIALFAIMLMVERLLGKS
ncbi:MAG TPA: metal ABC transporter permease, partial [Atopostipes sp.]|nr:metal ABC transporter permease [Atopostipes sp.]